jgi:hypothetical protein
MERVLRESIRGLGFEQEEGEGAEGFGRFLNWIYLCALCCLLFRFLGCGDGF